MKKILLVIGLITVLGSCSKKWSCEQIVTTESVNGPIVLTYTHEFKGTKQEMKEFEESGNMEMTGTTSVTECK